MEEALVWILDRLHNIGLSSDAESLAAGLLCGDKSLFDASVIRDMRDAGMSHLLAVSGLHIGLLWVLVWWTLRPVLLVPARMGWYDVAWYRGVRIVSVALLWLYVWMIGFPPSAVRAATMLTLAQVSPLFGVESWSWSNLVMAALLMLCFDPMQMGQVGFQLSFAATAGILTFSRFLHGPWRLLVLTFSAQYFTLPLIAYYFHHLPLLGWVQGVLVVPIVALLVYGFVLLLCVPASWGMMVICGESLYHWLSLPVEALSWWVLHVAQWVTHLELFLVGGRVEFYPSLAEVCSLEVVLVGFAFLASRRL